MFLRAQRRAIHYQRKFDECIVRDEKNYLYIRVLEEERDWRKRKRRGVTGFVAMLSTGARDFECPVAIYSLLAR